MKYKRKVQEIDAVGWFGDNLQEMIDFCGEDYSVSTGSESTLMVTSVYEAFNGFRLRIGDYIIRENGYLETLSGTRFNLMYERAE